MGLTRDAFTALTVATAAGLAFGGVLGTVAPTPADASGSAAAPAVRVTSVDVLGSDRLEVTLHFTGRAVVPFTVTADGVALPRRSGDRVEGRSETLDFDAPPPDAALVVVLPDGSSVRP
ncbi:hypothetical protein KZZ52_12070 [Dactylosporangium sp. AC04546]|uniref:hypothetical protein n=1 Tax=Dactylosporangium sp. AC04546 TaxID=2862460 RepID=UPI001EDE2E29|nr:hypothetical protein [Dactylosporangium sp. AC04546]WVK86079.1 hypothetical protein KZZ52_12070 [Dactylosporangium sp. AC04546]